MHTCVAGKTTLAKSTAELMHALGLLHTVTVVLKSGPQLVRRSRAIVAEAFESANGGVLFMDEADTLAGGGMFCRDVLDCLIGHMSSPTHKARASISPQPHSSRADNCHRFNQNKTMVITAGRPEKMQQLIMTFTARMCKQQGRR